MPAKKPGKYRQEDPQDFSVKAQSEAIKEFYRKVLMMQEEE